MVLRTLLVFHACLVAFAENEALEAPDRRQLKGGGEVSTIFTSQFWVRKLPSPLGAGLSISFGFLSLLAFPTPIPMAVSSRRVLQADSHALS